MAYEKHLATLKQGVDAWNAWREENPDLSGADLSGALLYSANLKEADFSGAKLKGTKIDGATKLDNKWQLVWKILKSGW